MRVMTITLAAAGLAAFAMTAPAAAQQVSGPPVFADGHSGFSGSFDGHRRHDGRHGRRFDRGFGGGLWIDGDREYQGDTAWRSNSFNDWWHDRPDRAFPRWMQSNQNCERMWSSGSGWRC